MATLTRHSRIFVDKKSPEIIEEVLAASGITDYELKLDADYPTLEHVCQYQESNFAFIARWLEREGMYFFFEQGDAGEKLIITDSLAYHDPLVEAPVRYVPLSGDQDVMALEALNAFACRRSMLPAEVALTDYDYRNPSLALHSTAAVDGTGAIVLHGENFRTSSDGDRLAKVRAEAFLCRRKVFHGFGRVFNLRPGYEFTVEDHPQGSMNAAFLVTDLVHHGNQSGSSDQVKKLLEIEYDDEYRVDLIAIPEDVQYRPERSTPIPRIDGVLHAVADGPSDSAYGQIDDQGRYKVKLKLDESGLSDGGASMWVRMLQFHAGGTEGVHFPIRKGTEVLLVFLGGDPDRPMICGAAPNPQKPSPVTSSNHTMNILITGGSNYIAMQDEADKQWIDISTPPYTTFMHLGYVHDDCSHEIVLNTEANALFNFGGNQDIEVGGDLYEHVVGDVTEEYDADHDTVVAGDQTLEVGCDRDIEVGGDQTVEIGGDFDTEVGGDTTLEVGGDYDTEVGGDITFENGGDFDVEVAGDITFENGGDYDIETGGDYTCEASGDIVFENPNNFVVDCGTNFEGTFGGDWNNVIMGKKNEQVLGSNDWFKLGFEFELRIGGKLDITIAADASIKAALALEAVTGIKIECDMAAKVNVEAGGTLKTLMNEIAGGAILKMDAVPGLRMLSAPLVVVA